MSERQYCITCIVSLTDEANHNFQSLKSYLQENEVLLATTRTLDTIGSCTPLRCTIVFYSDNVEELVIEDSSGPMLQLLSQLGQMEGQPDQTIIHFASGSILSTALYLDSTFIVVRLNSTDKKIDISYPHTFYDIDGALNACKKPILDQIRNSGVREQPKMGLDTSDVNHKVIESRINGSTFPVLDSGDILLPGSRVLGERGFWYDAEGVIVDIRKVDSTGNVWKDWAAVIAFHRGEDKYTLAKGLLDWVNILELARPLVANLIPSTLLLGKAKPLLKNVDDELLAYIAKHPDTLRHLNPEGFEDLVCSLYAKRGFAVEKIGRCYEGDEGVDIIAVKMDTDVGRLKLAIQCKHSKNTIRPAVIRELNGAIDNVTANLGVVATSSTFSAASFAAVEKSLWRIRLEDRTSIIGQLQSLFSS